MIYVALTQSHGDYFGELLTRLSEEIFTAYDDSRQSVYLYDKASACSYYVLGREVVPLASMLDRRC
jgi:hypothetical protein